MPSSLHARFTIHIDLDENPCRGFNWDCVASTAQFGENRQCWTIPSRTRRLSPSVQVRFDLFPSALWLSSWNIVRRPFWRGWGGTALPLDLPVWFSCLRLCDNTAICLARFRRHYNRGCGRQLCADPYAQVRGLLSSIFFFHVPYLETFCFILWGCLVSNVWLFFFFFKPVC